MRIAVVVAGVALMLAPALMASPQQDPRPPAVMMQARPPAVMSSLTMPIPPDNPITPAKVALGKRLFLDPILSDDRSVSCATCHIAEHGFADMRPVAVGVHGRGGRRNAPSLINRGFGRAQFWDGRAATLEAQVLQPISDPNEMNLPQEEAIARLSADASYSAAFQDVFERPIAPGDLGRALATYLRTIRSGDSPYDRFIAGQTDAMTAEQQKGYQLFRGKAQCFVCHFEPLFTADSFENTGIAWRIDPQTTAGKFQDDGRYTVTQLERDRGGFKVPTLREVASTAPYMHDGSLATLEDVLEFYDPGGRANPTISRLLRPIGLTSDEKHAIIAFLQALSGTVSGK